MLKMTKKRKTSIKKISKFGTLKLIPEKVKQRKPVLGVPVNLGG